jgi:NAD(P)-dependent dehydrogenase (short-subunit alcohol dehydrogenase family)
VYTLALDTSSLTSVREAATKFCAMLGHGEIDSFQALLCNAGGRHNGPLSFSPEGYETTFATNCLGHFLLIELLTGRWRTTDGSCSPRAARTIPTPRMEDGGHRG